MSIKSRRQRASLNQEVPTEVLRTTRTRQQYAQYSISHHGFLSPLPISYSAAAMSSRPIHTVLSHVRSSPGTDRRAYLLHGPVISDQWGSHTVPNLRHSSVFTTEILQYWPAATELHEKLRRHLLRPESVELSATEFLRLPNLPVGMRRTEPTPALAFVSPKGVLNIGGHSVTGKCFLMCVPDDPFVHAAIPFESTPLMSHFMTEEKQPPLHRVAEFAHAMDIQKLRMEKDQAREREEAAKKKKEEAEMKTGEGQVITIRDKDDAEAAVANGEASTSAAKVLPTEPPRRPGTPMVRVVELPPIATLDQIQPSVVSTPEFITPVSSIPISAQAAGVVQDLPTEVIQPPDEQETHLQYPVTPPPDDTTVPNSPTYEGPPEEEDQLPGEMLVLPEGPVPKAEPAEPRYDLRPRVGGSSEEASGGRVYAVKRKVEAEGGDKRKKRRDTPRPATILDHIVVPADDACGGEALERKP